MNKHLRKHIPAFLLALAGIAALLLTAGCGGAQRQDADPQEETTAEAPQEQKVQTDKIDWDQAADDDSAALSDSAAHTETKTLTISATGDCTLGQDKAQGYSGSFDSYYDSNGEDYFFSDVRSIFEEDDLTIINLECVLSTSTDVQEKEFNLKGAPEYVGILTGSSVEAASLGNNHTYDYGEEGFSETKQVLTDAGITYAYSGTSGLFVSDSGVTVGLVSASLLSEDEGKVETMLSEISSLRGEGAEVVIACCHWGIEKEHDPTNFQQETAHALIDGGADLVIGNHPHVLQGIEVYNGRVICYSLGNFCFGGNTNPADKNTAIFQQTFTVVDGQVQQDAPDARMIPCRISSADSYNDYQPTVAEGDRREEIISQLNEYSAPLGTVFFDTEGNLQWSGGEENGA